MSLTLDDIKKLWDKYKIQVSSSSEEKYVINFDGLKKLFSEINADVNDLVIQRIFSEVDTDQSGSIEFKEFQAALTSEKGSHRSRLTIAFDVFDHDHTGKVGLEDLEWVMSKFEMTKEEIKELLAEVDTTGDGLIDFEEFCKLIPEDTTKWYRDSPAPINLEKSTIPSTEIPKNQEKGEIIQESKEQKLIKQDSVEKTGTSLLQMQIGMFRLLQGAAYRSFRENYSANIETHLRVRNLPYTVSNFVKFVRVAINFYKSLGIVEEACHPLLDDVVISVEKEYEMLLNRIKNWTTLEKTPEMIAAQKELEKSRKKSYSLREKFAAGIEFALTMRKNAITLSDLVDGALAVQEINRLRKLDLQQDFSPKPTVNSPKDYLNVWNKVILEKEEEEIDGAIMQTAFWYEEFMPKLLAAFSVGKAEDIKNNTVPDEAALDQWFNTNKETGHFSLFGKDVLEGFPKCTPKQKLEIKQAWNLTSYYLNGVQKRRERAEFGRDDGSLCYYVAFIDVYLNRSSIQNAEMRLSFPYFIGCAVWHFYHTSAEIACSAPQNIQTNVIIPAFKNFFPFFATMYPCPYCRHHLNMYVIRNREIDLYPLEYVLLGRSPTKGSGDFEVNIDAKMSSVVDGPSLRFFFWKLHNTVSSSIARTEEWYHKDTQAFYTTRYWPSLDSELTRSKIFKENVISTGLVDKLYDLLKPMSHLSGLRRDFQRLLEEKKVDEAEETCKLAGVQILALEEAVMRGYFLQDTYHFNPTLVGAPPSFSPEEEEFARSGRFLAW